MLNVVPYAKVFLYKHFAGKFMGMLIIFVFQRPLKCIIARCIIQSDFYNVFFPVSICMYSHGIRIEKSDEIP